MYKKPIRKKMLLERNNLKPDEVIQRSNIIKEKLYAMHEFISSTNVFIYMDFYNEVITKDIVSELLNDELKQVAVPKVCDKEMKFYYISSFNELAKNSWGILEPITDREAIPTTNTVIIMPGVVFDKKCNRIGYGGGYYDKYLSKHCNMSTIALAFEMQVVDMLEIDDYDIKPNILITEQNIYK